MTSTLITLIRSVWTRHSSPSTSFPYLSPSPSPSLSSSLSSAVTEALVQLDLLSTEAFAVEVACRHLTLFYCRSRHIEALHYLFHLVTSLAEREKADALLPLQIMDEAFECSSVSDSERLFGCVVSLQSRLFVPKFHTQRQRLCVLKMCNSLLKRLNKTSQTSFCGRVQAFASSSTPVDERGGLNLSGRCNVDTSTVVDSNAKLTNAAHLNLINNEEGSDCNVSNAVDFAFYRTLWSLQSAFSDPQSLFTSPSAFATFVASLTTVLDAFAQCAPDRVPPSTQSDQHNVNYFPKYLSGSRLINLQMRDPTFRRHIFLQCLIIIHYLSNQQGSPQSTLKTIIGSDTESVLIAWKSSAVPSLTVAQLERLYNLLLRTLLLLRDTPSSTSSYTAALLELFSQESVWLKWKREKAPSFVKPAALFSEPLVLPTKSTAKNVRPGRKRKRVMMLNDMDVDASIPRSFEGRANMGSEAAAALYAVPNNVDAISNNARNFLPDIAVQLQPLIEEEIDRACRMKKGEPVEDVSEMQRSNQVKSWKLMRLMRRVDTPAFMKSEGSLWEVIKERVESSQTLQAETALLKLAGTAVVDPVTNSDQNQQLADMGGIVDVMVHKTEEQREQEEVDNIVIAAEMEAELPLLESNSFQEVVAPFDDYNPSHSPIADDDIDEDLKLSEVDAASSTPISPERDGAERELEKGSDSESFRSTMGLPVIDETKMVDGNDGDNVATSMEGAK